MATDIKYEDIKEGDIISAKEMLGNHLLTFQDGFKINLTPPVEVVKGVNGILYAGNVSLLSFKGRVILKHN